MNNLKELENKNLKSLKFKDKKIFYILINQFKKK